MIVTYWTALGAWLAPGGRRFEPTNHEVTKMTFFFFFFFIFLFFFVPLRFAHRRPPYCDVRISLISWIFLNIFLLNGKLVKKNHGAKEGEGRPCCMLVKTSKFMLLSCVQQHRTPSQGCELVVRLEIPNGDVVSRQLLLRMLF